MILQALCEYYQRKQQDPDDALAPFGFEEKGIPFVIVINQDGHFIQFEDTRTLGGKSRCPASLCWQRESKRHLECWPMCCGIQLIMCWE